MKRQDGKGSPPEKAGFLLPAEKRYKFSKGGKLYCNAAKATIKWTDSALEVFGGLVTGNGVQRVVK